MRLSEMSDNEAVLAYVLSDNPDRRCKHAAALLQTIAEAADRYGVAMRGAIAGWPDWLADLLHSVGFTTNGTKIERTPNR